ncbi:MAG: DUF374 domain-containing protein [bacterium]|nr:DUF374 domain-containing protein [bacterium]
METRNQKTRWFREFRKRQAYNVLPVFPPLVRSLIRALGFTLRGRFSGEGPVMKMVQDGQPFVLAFFHGRQLLLVHELRGWPVVVMTGISYMGEIQSRVLAGFGVTTVMGSSKGGGARVLAGMIKLVRKGMVGAFAVDGPRGPYGVVKPGAVYISKKLGIPLVPVTTSASPSALFTSVWDRYLLPMPFSRTLVKFGEIMVLDQDLSDEAIQRDCRLVEKVLEKLTRGADELVGRP